MKNSSKCFFSASLAVAILFCELFTSNGRARADTAPIATLDITNICQGWPVPTGYVITDFDGFTAMCNGLSQYTVSLAMAGMSAGELCFGCCRRRCRCWPQARCLR